LFLAARQVARRPAGLRLAAMLAVAVGLASFGVSGEAVAAGNRDARAQAELGAQRVVAMQFERGVDPVAGAGYLAVGFSAVSEVAAVDLGVRGDLFPYGTASTRNFLVGLSLRLFVPGAVASAAAAQSP